MPRRTRQFRAHPRGALSRIFANAGAAAPLIFLAACAAAPEGAGDFPPSRDSAASQPAETESNVIPVVQPPERESAGAPAAPETAARVVRADELVGKKDAEIRELLGKPSLIRRDRQAQVWQYRGRSCVLDLFLYPPADSKNAAPEQAGARAVVYLETRGKDAAKVSGDRCVSEVLAARGGAG